MEYSKKIDESKLNNITNNIDTLLKNVYERKISIEDLFSNINESYDLSYLVFNTIKEDDIIKSFSTLIKKKLGKKKIKTNTTKDIAYFYHSMVTQINNSETDFHIKQIFEIIGYLTFESKGIKCELKNIPKNNKEKIQYYLIDKAKSFIEKNLTTDKAIYDFLKINHILFLTDDNFQFVCFKFFLVINDFLYEKYGLFSNYNDYLMNFYYLYYKYTQENHLYEFKEKILSRIDENNCAEFSLDNNCINEKSIAILIFNLNNLISNNKRFKLKIENNLLNNPLLLKLFNLKIIEEKKIKSFFRYSIVQSNYLNFFNNKDENFTVSVDKLNYDEDKLHVFNIFFLIACGLCDKIEEESLQIFNSDNHVINLFKKYANILLEKINSIILKIKNNNNNSDLNDNEFFGFGKIFNTFYVLYSNLNSNKYTEEKLKFDLIDTLTQKNDDRNPMLEIKFNLDKSEVDSNFSQISVDSKKNMNDEQKYHEKVNASSLEEECKTYILSKINNLINENKEQIQIIEIYKILFGMNFYIPYIDENYDLKFIPTKKQLNNINSEYPEYGYQEFDYLFKVIGNEDILMNQNNNNYLPFVSCLQINIISKKSFNQFEYDVNMEYNQPFSIKKNALVIVENKLKFPSQKDKIVKFIKIMIKKLNFIIKLIKNTTNDFYSYDNIQLLLIYDDVIVNKDELKKLINVEQIKSILTSIPFNERAKFSVEIIYISQTVNVYNISKAFDEINKLNVEIKELKVKIDKLEKILGEHGWLNEEN